MHLCFERGHCSPLERTLIRGDRELQDVSSVTPYGNTNRKTAYSLDLMWMQFSFLVVRKKNVILRDNSIRILREF